MRLIDADALLKQLLEAKDDEIIKAVIGLVQTQPTAYDVEKVVAELVEADSGYCWMCGGGIDGKTAIEIVKAGGIK
jgi:hypothetical protein